VLGGELWVIAYEEATVRRYMQEAVSFRPTAPC